jgi:hypothetical protein
MKKDGLTKFYEYLTRRSASDCLLRPEPARTQASAETSRKVVRD